MNVMAPLWLKVTSEKGGASAFIADVKGEATCEDDMVMNSLAQIT